MTRPFVRDGMGGLLKKEENMQPKFRLLNPLGFI